MEAVIHKLRRGRGRQSGYGVTEGKSKSVIKGEIKTILGCDLQFVNREADLRRDNRGRKTYVGCESKKKPRRGGDCIEIHKNQAVKRNHE